MHASAVKGLMSIVCPPEQPATVSGPRPEPIPSSQLTSDSNGTSSDGSSGGGGNSGGAIAAGILVPLLVVTAAVAVAGVLLFIYFKRKATGGEEAKSNGVIAIGEVYFGEVNTEIKLYSCMAELGGIARFVHTHCDHTCLVRADGMNECCSTDAHNTQYTTRQ